MPTSADYGRSSCRIVCYGLLDRRLYVREKNVITFEDAAINGALSLSWAQRDLVAERPPVPTPSLAE
jgi:hypothetical protein